MATVDFLALAMRARQVNGKSIDASTGPLRWSRLPPPMIWSSRESGFARMAAPTCSRQLW